MHSTVIEMKVGGKEEEAGNVSFFFFFSGNVYNKDPILLRPS